MRSTFFTSRFLTLAFALSSNAFPGLHALAAHRCADGALKVDGGTCSNTLSSTLNLRMTATTKDIPNTITPSVLSVALAFHPKVDVVTATCDDDECSIFDVTSRLITVVSLPSTTGTSTAPFANGTSDGQHTVGATGSGTDVLPGTGVSPTTSAWSNSTTIITSRITLSVTTVTGADWLDWTSTPAGTIRTSNPTADASGRPVNSANATDLEPMRSAPHWSAWSRHSSESPITRPTPMGSTYRSSDPTSIGSDADPRSTLCSPGVSGCLQDTTSRTFVATSTFTFSGTTIIIPIPSGYGWPKTSAMSTTSSLTNRPTNTSMVDPHVTSTLSTSSCWTTSDRSVSGTGINASPSPSKICWILSCDANARCTDHVTRYPITVDAQSASTLAPYANSTNSNASLTFSASTGTISAISTGTSDIDTMWRSWSSGSDLTRTASPSGNTSTSNAMTTSETDVNSFLTSTGTFIWTTDGSIVSRVVIFTAPFGPIMSAQSSDAVSTTTSAFESTFDPWLGWPSTLSTMQSSSSMTSRESGF